MLRDSVSIGGRKFRLAKRIGRGGEGEIYRVKGNRRHAVKLYITSEVADRESKIHCMIKADLARLVPQVAFPLAVARNADDQFCGFSMKLVSGHKPLHELYSPGSRKHHFPRADYRFLVRTAANISRVVAAVHGLGCVIGDINHSSILVSKSGAVALIDADSFQIESESKLHFCRVGVPKYTPPELQGMPLGDVPRTINHDAFGLAIVIFQLLLMGRHPFIGTTGQGEAPLLAESIRDYRFAYGKSRDAGMGRPPGTPALCEFPRAIGAAFETAFGRDTKDDRPTALAWATELANLEHSLVPCREDKLHWHAMESVHCPWCAMERKSGTVLFGAPLSASVSQPTIVAFGAYPHRPALRWSQVANLRAGLRRKLAILILVVLLHVPVAYAFVTGLGTAAFRIARTYAPADAPAVIKVVPLIRARNGVKGPAS